MMTITHLRRPLRVKLGAWIEALHLHFLILNAERDIEAVKLNRDMARKQIAQDTDRIEQYELHVVELTKRLGRARAK